MKRFSLNFLLLISCFSVISICEAANQLYSINFGPCEIRVIDPVNGATKGVRLIQFVDLDFDCAAFGHGLVRHPVSGDLWFSAKLRGNSSHRVLRMNPTTGVLSFVGNTGSPIETLAFNKTGSLLYGVSAENTYIAETLFKLNQTDGNAEPVCTLGNGDTGEAIAFNPDDLMIYHASGNQSKVFEKVNPTTCQTSNVGFKPANFGVQATALTYVGSGSFLMADFSTLFDLSTTGNLTNGYRFLDHASKGLAFANGTLTHTNLSIGGTCRRSGKNSLSERITIRNLSANAANGVLIGTRLPSSMFYLSDSRNSCIGYSSFVSCAIGSVPGMSTITIDIQFYAGFSRQTNVKHSFRLSSNQYETNSTIQDNSLIIDDDCN